MTQFNWAALSEDEVAKLLGCADAGRVTELDGEYLCRYAAEDTDSTWLFYSEIIRPALDKFKALEEFHREYFTSLAEHIVVQQLIGVQLDVAQLDKHERTLQDALEQALRTLQDDEQLRSGVDAFHETLLEAYDKAEPAERFKPVRPLPPEPEKFGRGGKILAAWLKWDEKRRHKETERPESSTQWRHWWEKRIDLTFRIKDYWAMSLDERQDAGFFNLFSNAHRKWLFYDFLQHPVLVLTKKQEPSTGGDALLGFGELGKKFDAVDEIRKELQFCASLRKASDMERGVYHPKLKTPGTHTGRLSGEGGLNYQNTPKSANFLETFIPRKGCVLLDIDCSSLEPTIIAEMSRDKGLLSVYGKDASPYQDIYILVGSALPGIGEEFTTCGYDPKNPTKEAVERCKTEHKTLRNVCKQLKLSADYGAGARKWYSSLKMRGFSYTLEQCKMFHVAFWELFKDIKRFESRLQVQWEKNGGWLLDALGLPFCVATEAVKDLQNRCVQRSGHEILQMLQFIIIRNLRREGISYRPFNYDIHDQLILEVRTADGKRGYEIMQEAFDELNTLLYNGDTVVRFKGSGGVLVSFAESKVEGYKSFRRKPEAV